MGGAANDLAIRPPSAVGRAIVSLALLLGFYVVILGTAAALFVAPVAAAWLYVQSSGRFNLQLLIGVVIFWLAAFLIGSSVFGTRRPAFVPPKRRLQRDEAPALFAMIDELAACAGTAPPGEVYLDALPNLGVTEVGGFRRSRRVLVLGAPMLHILRVDELRSALAHELGHFLGGDTRLTAFTMQTHALFASVVTAVERDPFRQGTSHYAVEGGFALAQAIGRGLVRTYGRFFLWVTHATGRRQELAADALSAALVGAPTAARALETAAVAIPLYMQYLQGDVGFAVTKGAMPSDLVAGYERLRERLLATDAGRAFVERVHSRVTDPYDTHPSLRERLGALVLTSGVGNDAAFAGDAAARAGGTAAAGTEPRASSLFADPAALDAWTVEETRALVIAAAASEGRPLPAVRTLPWERIPDEAYAPAAREAARRLAERLHPLLPGATTLGAMFAAAWRALEGGKMPEIALRVEPGLARMPRHEAERAATGLCGEIVTTLLQGALLERGAAMDDSLGEPALVLHLGGERVSPGELLGRLARDTAGGRAELEAWARRLG